VASGSTSGTKSDYNVVYAGPGGTVYSWAGNTYSDLASFTAATGQGGPRCRERSEARPLPNNFTTPRVGLPLGGFTRDRFG